MLSSDTIGDSLGKYTQMTQLVTILEQGFNMIDNRGYDLYVRAVGWAGGFLITDETYKNVTETPLTFVIPLLLKRVTVYKDHTKQSLINMLFAK